MRVVAFIASILLGYVAQAQPDKHWTDVEKQYAKGHYYGGLRICDRMLAGKTPKQEFLVLRAEGNNRIAEFEKAMRDSKAAHDVLQGDLKQRAALQLGIALQSMGWPDSARHWYVEAFGSTVDTEARYRIGSLDRMAGRTAEAVAAFDQVLQQRPDHVQALRARGGCRAELGDSAAARADLDGAIALAPRDPVSWNARGFELHARAGRWREAISDYDQAIRFDPNYSYAFNNRGWAYYKLGDMDRAMRDISLAARKKKANPYVYRNLGVIALEGGDKDKACNHFRVALDMRFTAMHGSEVEDLMRANCGGKATPADKPAAKPGGEHRTNAPERSNAP